MAKFKIPFLRRKKDIKSKNLKNMSVRELRDSSLKPAAQYKSVTKYRNTSDKYSSIAKERKRAIWRNRLKEIKIQLPLKTIFLLLLILGSLFTILVLRNSAFNIQDVKVIAPKEVIEEINSIVGEYKGTNIYLVREAEVAAKIKTQVPEIEDIYLYKEFPDKIIIEAVQGNPVLILADLAKVDLLDATGKSIGSFSGIQKAGLSEDELKILQGEKDLESDTIKLKYLEGKSDEEKLLFDWSKVSSEDKNRIYDEIKSAIESKVSSYFAGISDIYSKSIYNSLPLVQSYSVETLDEKDVNLIVSLIDGISSRGINISKNFLSSKFTLDLTVEDNKMIRLSLRRTLENQIKEIDTVIYYGYFSSARIIDLRSETYSITR